ncbi:hypothetical protein VaNZ11_001511 [Volvox africanus]|uniref:Uncharacterized protein n=1 Tax=Volvox africanus TaxID=51714 RepID=A0ABQ5RQQ8_9CHLO|nr:hypothetical protein VaNZ11_001511 [Volvox africanus]
MSSMSRNALPRNGLRRPTRPPRLTSCRVPKRRQASQQQPLPLTNCAVINSAPTSSHAPVSSPHPYRGPQRHQHLDPQLEVRQEPQQVEDLSVLAVARASTLDTGLTARP